MGISGRIIPKSRIESLSDLIFGLALSIGAIALIGSYPKNSAEVISDLVVFGFSFLVLINFWVRYTRIMGVIPIETRRVATLNLFMLFLVAVEPYLLNLFRFDASSTCQVFGSVDLFFSSPGCIDFFASTLFAFDLGILYIILAFLDQTVVSEDKKLVPIDLKRFKRSRNMELFIAVMFLVSAIPQLGIWSVSLALLGNLTIRYILWLIPAISSPLIRRIYVSRSAGN